MRTFFWVVYHFFNDINLRVIILADKLDLEALDYHRKPAPGKIAVIPTKPLANQHDLSLAYSPGVAAASLLIAKDPSEASNLTSRANLVGVISNGSAVLGLGNIGALAAKPVMEGKAGLFKTFAGINVFDIEIDVWWVDNEFWLGHDNPQYPIEENYLENPKFWCHAKNIEGLYKMLNNNKIHCFFHQEDDVTLTSKGYIWTYPNKQLTDKSIAVLPKTIDKNLKCFGVCTDEVTKWI